MVTEASDWSGMSCVQRWWISGSSTRIAWFSDSRSSGFLYLRKESTTLGAGFKMVQAQQDFGVAEVGRDFSFHQNRDHPLQHQADSNEDQRHS